MPVKLIQPTASAYAYPLLIKQLLHTALSTAPQQEITYQGKIRYSYLQFRTRIAKLANSLSTLGIEAGHTVAVMDWDSHRYLECFFAIPMMGAILQTVNVRLSHEQILYTLNHAAPSVLLVNSEFLPIVTAIADRLESVRHFVLISDESLAVTPSINCIAEYEAMLGQASEHYDFPDFDENAQATVFYTTGTTGNPKGVHFSHRQLVLHTLALAAATGGAPTQGRMHREDVYMPMTPMFHVHAWGFPYLSTMLGLKQVYPGKYMPETLLNLIKTEKISYSHCVPTVMHMLLSNPLAESIDFAGWKVVIGGSALPRKLAQQALDRGIDLYTGYGMSETCPVLTLAHLTSEHLVLSQDEQISLRCKTGRPMPLVDLHVVDSQQRALPQDGHSTGEVVVRSPWLTQAYLGAPEASEALWEGGYLHTADIGHIDPQGYLQITDRIKDVIKTAGEWTSSLQLEELIAQHEAVSEVAVIGLRDAKWGERPHALVVLKPEFMGKISEQALRRNAAHLIESRGLSRHGVLLQVEFVSALLRTSVGKINKRAMREAREG